MYDSLHAERLRQLCPLWEAMCSLCHAQYVERRRCPWAHRSQPEDGLEGGYSGKLCMDIALRKSDSWWKSVSFVFSLVTGPTEKSFSATSDANSCVLSGYCGSRILNITIYQLQNTLHSAAGHYHRLFVTEVISGSLSVHHQLGDEIRAWHHTVFSWLLTRAIRNCSAVTHGPGTPQLPSL